MINGTPITVVGNLGSDPELRYTPTGNAVATMNIAVPQRRYNRDTQQWDDTGTTWYKVIAWRYLAEHAAESLIRGMRVIATGTLAARPWEDKEGNKRESWEITAEALGPDLSYATATVKKAAREDTPLPDDPWASDTAASGTAPAGNSGTRPRKTREPAAAGTAGHAQSDEPPF